MASHWWSGTAGLKSREGGTDGAAGYPDVPSLPPVTATGQRDTETRRCVMGALGRLGLLIARFIPGLLKTRGGLVHPEHTGTCRRIDFNPTTGRYGQEPSMGHSLL